ncbi:hypothetical protein ACHAWF_014399 [Thalassiosira exigua]
MLVQCSFVLGNISTHLHVLALARSVAERIASLKSHMDPDSPKVGNSGTNSAALNRAAGEAQSTIRHSGSLEDRWKRVQSAAESYNTSHQKSDDDRQQPQANDAKHDGNPFEDSAINSAVSGEDDMMWQAAIDRFEKEHYTPTGHESELNGSLNEFERKNPPPAQEVQDQEYARRMSDMDRLGGLDRDFEQPSPAGGGDNLSLWETFKFLYKRNPMIKYYIVGLLILMIATVAIIGVSLSQRKKSRSKDCGIASFSDGSFLLIPHESHAVTAGGFGTSMSASSDHLIVGAPDSVCKPPCNNTVGGGAYLYKRNSKREWSLYSSYVQNDGVSEGDKFGRSVAISDDSTTVVVGAPKSDGLGLISGQIYVMEQPFSTTIPPIRLTPLDIGLNDEFGGSVAVSATILGKESSVHVVNIIAGSFFDDDSGSNSGSVYVFSKFSGIPPVEACGGTEIVGRWVECHKLLPDDGQMNDRFGTAVDISGRTAVVGAMWDDDRGIDSGSAYVFSLDDRGIWSQQQKLSPVNFESKANRFGVSVATSGGRIVVGSDLDDSHGEDSGAAYVYSLSNGVWNLESRLVPTVFGDPRGYECGYSVDISQNGEIAVVGCPGAAGGGLSFVYERVPESGRWVQKEMLDVQGTVASSLMGGSVAISGEDMVVVGYGKSNGEVFSYRKDC